MGGKMVGLLELKEKIVRFFGKYEVYLMLLLKFFLSVIALVMINTNIGYMKSISSLSIILLLSAICSVLPINGMIVILSAVILLHLYALSMEVFLVGFLIFAAVYFVYFRFAPKYGYNAILMPICLKMGIPYIVPISSGLMGDAYSVLSVVCGTLVYYFLNGVHLNEAVLSDAAEVSGNTTSKFVITMNQFIGNKEMFLAAGIFAAATIIVYIIRSLEIDNAWLIAWAAGLLFEVISLIAGYMLFGISGKMAGVIVGGMISSLLAFGIQFLFFNLDYTRTERLQFEDDEYYYYVKAVPKAVIASSDKQVKHFNRKEEKERLTRKKFAEEMEIDEELLN